MRFALNQGCKFKLELTELGLFAQLELGKSLKCNLNSTSKKKKRSSFELILNLTKIAETKPKPDKNILNSAKLSNNH